ncbi:UBA domain-containing protein 7 [Neolecta irregularis DAH-3]|uniref:UBA domain-containing protein 7 n=1 Tax=Neolecta irregularis (strain DAH-3) TaxID=1198029 RepID=A0A1U7LV09_NEOID|nr:UBA domain-containing protein 7 [Neolecta irregularis DAH-3]|eukprot:OLL26351.1 UBA domain-containing protein 7 [Neolecta irregularis DAH-3]
MDDLIGLQWSSNASTSNQSTQPVSSSTQNTAKGWFRQPSSSRALKNASPAPPDSFSGLVELSKSPVYGRSTSTQSKDSAAAASQNDTNKFGIHIPITSAAEIQQKCVSSTPTHLVTSLYPSSETDVVQCQYFQPPLKFEANDLEDPFSLSSFNGDLQTPRASRHNRASIEEGMNFDILGILGQPISVSESPETHSSSVVSEQPTQDPRDEAITSIIDMGFSIEQALAALSETDTGFDLEMALDLLLRQKYNEERKESDYYSTSSKESPVVPARWDVQNHVSKARDPRKSSSQARSYQSFGSNRSTPELLPAFFNRAGSIWKQSRAKVQKTVEDFSKDDSGNQVPKWMRESSSQGSSRTQTPANHITEEAKMLEMEKPKRKGEKFVDNRQNLPVTPQSSSQPKTKVTRKTSLSDLDQKAEKPYVSPLRRRKQALESESSQNFNNITAGLKIHPTIPNGLKAATSRSESPANPQYVSQSHLMRPLIQISPGSLSNVTKYRLQGLKAFQRGDFPAALESYTNALSTLPPLHELRIIIHANQALCNIKLGDAKAAIQNSEDGLLIIGPGKGKNEYINLDNSIRDMKQLWVKTVTRKAQAFEQLERYSEAKEAWTLLLNEGFSGQVALEGKRRCEKAFAPIPVSVAQRSATVYRPKPSRSLNSEAVTRLRQTTAELAEEDARKLAMHDFVSSKIDAWQRGKELNVRALLASLDNVLWPETGWQNVGMDKLVNPARVKFFYFKAIAKVHPDKISKEATTEQKMLSASVFSALNKAWDDFKALNGLS